MVRSLLRLRAARVIGETEVTLGQNMEVNASLNKVEWSVGGVRVRWCTSYENGYAVNKDVLAKLLVKVGDRNWLERFELLMRPAQLVIANHAVHSFA